MANRSRRPRRIAVKGPKTASSGFQGYVNPPKKHAVRGALRGAADPLRRWPPGGIDQHKRRGARNTRARGSGDQHRRWDHLRRKRRCGLRDGEPKLAQRTKRQKNSGAEDEADQGLTRLGGIIPPPSAWSRSGGRCGKANQVAAFHGVGGGFVFYPYSRDQ